MFVLHPPEKVAILDGHHERHSAPGGLYKTVKKNSKRDQNMGTNGMLMSMAE